MTKVSEMSNEQLCEAISELREPKPDLPEVVLIVEIGYNKPSELKNWILDFIGAKWEPINWLLPENWTRLLVEMKDNIVYIDYNGDFPGVEPYWRISIYKKGIKNNRDYLRDYLDVKSSTLSRLSCEAWLIVFGGGKYE